MKFLLRQIKLNLPPKLTLKMLFRFKKVDSPLCSYCNEEEETPIHLFHSCLKTKQLWNRLRQYFSQFINIPLSTPQSSILGIFDNNQHSELINHLLLIFKFDIYSTRNTKSLYFDNLNITIKKIKDIENELTSSKKLKLLKKWHAIDHMIDWYSVLKWKSRGAGASNFILFSFVVVVIVLVLFVKKNCPVLSCFIDFIFNRFAIS